jgi:hypothetical protein
VRFKTEISARYRDPDTGTVTEITFKRTDVEAPDAAGAKTSALGLALSICMPELLNDPDTRTAITVVPDPSRG